MPCTAQIARQLNPNFNLHPTYTEQDYMILLLLYYTPLNNLKHRALTQASKVPFFNVLSIPELTLTLQCKLNFAQCWVN